MKLNKVWKYCDYVSLCRIALKDFHKQKFNKLGVVEFISTNTGDVWQAYVGTIPEEEMMKVSLLK